MDEDFIFNDIKAAVYEMYCRHSDRVEFESAARELAEARLSKAPQRTKDFFVEFTLMIFDECVRRGL
jgi:hypothetical protein